MNRSHVAQAASLLIFIIACVASRRCDAAVIFLKGKDDPLKVRIISENERQLIVGEPQPDGSFRQRILLRTQIDEIILAVSPERLGELSPDNPAGYRNYAEELAEKRTDPDARAEAIRLYLIAAHLSPDELGRGALLGMVSLARTAGEQRRFRAMAYLADPKHDASLLKTTAVAVPAAADPTGQRALLLALRNIRRGERAQSQRMLGQESVRQALQGHGDLLTLEQLQQALEESDGLPPATLARMLRLELRLTGGAAAPVRSDPSALPVVNWSQAISTEQTEPLRPLTLATLTEFDPQKCVYRDGAWVTP